MLRNLLTKMGARTDARAGLASVEERIVAELGPRPALDAVRNAEHAEIAHVLTESAALSEAREDYARAEAALAGHPPASLLLAALIFAFASELAGAVLLMRAAGVAPAERLPFGATLGIALIMITALVTHVTGGRANGGDVNPPRETIGARVSRSAASIAVLTIYSAVVGAVTLIRIHGSAEEDASTAVIAAQGLVLLLTVAAPAWAAEWLIRRRAPIATLKKSMRVLRARIRREERRQERAQERVNEIARAGARWDAEAARRRALYATAHRLEQSNAARNPRGTSSEERT